MFLGIHLELKRSSVSVVHIVLSMTSLNAIFCLWDTRMLLQIVSYFAAQNTCCTQSPFHQLISSSFTLFLQYSVVSKMSVAAKMYYYVWYLFDEM
jgi:hypothetical protein